MTGSLKNDRAALAVAIEPQRVGLAVVTQNHLQSFAVVLTCRGGDTVEERVRYVLRGIERRLRAFDVTHLALVEPAIVVHPFTRHLHEEVARLADRRGLTPRPYRRRDLRELGGGTYRDLAFTLARRYPELRHRVREDLRPRGYYGLARPHDIYNRPLFLAIAAGERVLLDALVQELPSALLSL